MKDFNRFPHQGVLADLEAVKRDLDRKAGYTFGSSEEGVLTIRAPRRTAYVRRYKLRDQWSVALTRDVPRYQVLHMSSLREVLNYLHEHLF